MVAAAAAPDSPSLVRNSHGSALRAALLGVLGGVLAACSGGPSSNDSGATGTGRPGDLVAKRGTIIYHAPARGGERQKPAFTQSFTVASEEVIPEDDHVQLLRFKVKGISADEEARRMLAKRLFTHTSTRGTHRVITAQQFHQLVKRLETAGLFGLPDHPGETPPEGSSYFLVELDGTTLIFARPDLSGANRAPWLASLRAFVAFMNETTPLMMDSKNQ